MDQHTIELLIAAGSAPAALAAWKGVGGVFGYVLKKRADAKAKRDELEGQVLLVNAQTQQQQQARADAREDTAVTRLSERLDRVEEDLREARRELRECHEQRLADREKCAEETGALRADNAMLIGRVDVLTEKIERLENRVESIPPKAASMAEALRAAAEEGKETG